MSEETRITAPAGQFEEEAVQAAPETTLEKVEEQTGESPEAEAAADTFAEELLMTLSDKSLSEILRAFEEVLARGNQQEMYRCADAIKASFYKALKREKIAAGYVEQAVSEQTVSGQAVSEQAVSGQAAGAAEPVQAEPESVEAEAAEEMPASASGEPVSYNPFAEIERGFKELYGRYKALRGAYLQQQERQKEENLRIKLEIIESIRQLSEKQEDINQTFSEFRALQTRWRETGPVPQPRMKDVYETYQHHVEMFYDYVKINNELRDLDFRKNLAAKTVLCEKAEALCQEENVVSAFARLQKLHEEWKEYGPVEREVREAIWDRFKAATSIINKKHQAHFELVKEEQKKNLAAKTVLCEKAEAVAAREIADASGWNKASKELEGLQKEWKGIGFASKKDNQKIYDRFRAACDAFFDRKREYYADFKHQMTRNYEQKLALCEQAEALMDSTDWKKTTDELIHLQQLWKESGPVSRKKSEQIWKRFRAACDRFFENKDRNYGGADPKLVENLQAKQALIAEIESCDTPDLQAAREFQQRWNAIGFVPIREKDRIAEAFNRAMADKFPDFQTGRRGGSSRSGRDGRGRGNAPRSERDILIQQFRTKESELATYENNIGFFSASRNADALIAQFEAKIEATRKELKELEERIKSLEN